MDTDGTGMILASELANMLQKKEMAMSQDKDAIEDMIKEVDYYGNGKINYSEFLAATINVNTFMTDQKLQTIFQQFDTDNSGHITHENIKNAMQKLGLEISKKEIEEMISKHDVKGNNVLDFEEFALIFKGMAEQDKPGI